MNKNFVHEEFERIEDIKRHYQKEEGWLYFRCRLERYNFLMPKYRDFKDGLSRQGNYVFYTKDKKTKLTIKGSISNYNFEVFSIPYFKIEKLNNDKKWELMQEEG